MKALRLGPPALILAVSVVLEGASVEKAHALSNIFTYQGHLEKSGTPVNGACDFESRLFDAASGGTQVGFTQSVLAVSVNDGLFTLLQDFGPAPFSSGADRWLEIALRCPPAVGSYTTLSPRQQLTATPYALYAPSAGSAPWSGLSGVPAGFSDGTDDDTTYTQGTGLTLSGSQFSVNTTAIQVRVSGSCSAGSSIRSIDGSGGVVCESDDDTTYTEGTGLTLSGNQFSVNTATIQGRVSGSCSAGSSIRSIDASGGVVCEFDDDSGGTITGVTGGTGLSGMGTSGSVELNVDFGGTGTANTAARSDHDHGASYQKQYERTVVVSPVGTEAQNGTTLLNALAGIAPLASCSNPYLIKIEPGVYDLGTSILVMEECVDIEGSGEGVTEIRRGGTPFPNTGTVVGASNAELRFVTVKNTGGDQAAVAIFNSGGAALTITHVTAVASGGANENYAISNEDSLVRMTHVTAEATGGQDAIGVLSSSTDLFKPSPVLTSVRATAQQASDNTGLRNNSSSPIMTSVAATALCGAGQTCTGISNFGLAFPPIAGGSVFVIGGDTQYGMRNVLGAVPNVDGLIISVFGGLSSSGVRNEDAAAVLTHVRVGVFLAAVGFGIANVLSSTSGPYFVDIDASLIAANTNTINNDTSFTTRVGASKLQGGPVTGGGTITCAGVYDENYAFTAGPVCP